ncbi:hypothetical protein IWZ01DRAFT_320184 [Phyllosticta capitalensis]
MLPRRRLVHSNRLGWSNPHAHTRFECRLLESDPRSRRHNLCSLLLDVHASTRTANAGSPPPPPPPPHLPHVPPLGLSGEALVPLGCRAECTGAAPRQRKAPKHNERQNPPSACLPAWPRDTLTGYAKVPCRKKAVGETDRGARVASVLVQLVTTSSRRRPSRGERRAVSCTTLVCFHGLMQTTLLRSISCLCWLAAPRSTHVLHTYASTFWNPSGQRVRQGQKRPERPWLRLARDKLCTDRRGRAAVSGDRLISNAARQKRDAAAGLQPNVRSQLPRLD